MTDRESSGNRRLAARFRRLLDAIKIKRNSRQRLIEKLHDAEERHVIDPDTVAMMEGALLVSETQVRFERFPLCSRLRSSRRVGRAGSGEK